MKRISIIIPMYNTELYIERCVNSCLNQELTNDDFEIIIVNDGSIDGSLTKVTSLYNNHKTVFVVNQENKGLSGARNTGLRHASGEYVWFVDSDDWIESNCLKRVIELCKQQDLDILQFCAANIIDDKPVRRFHRRNTGMIMTGKECLKYRFPHCAPFSIYKRSFLQENNLSFYEGIFHEDNEFTPRTYYMAKRVEAIDDILYYVYQNPNSITRTINPKKSKDSIVVMKNLDAFSKDFKGEERKSFDDIITSIMNVALHDTLGLDEQDRHDFTMMLKNNRGLINHLSGSSSWVYHIEAWFLKLFPNHPIEVYKFLNLLDRRSVKTQEV